jgi:hypothetical protein
VTIATTPCDTRIVTNPNPVCTGKPVVTSFHTRTLQYSDAEHKVPSPAPITKYNEHEAEESKKEVQDKATDKSDQIVYSSATSYLVSFFALSLTLLQL